MLVTKSTSVAN